MEKSESSGFFSLLFSLVLHPSPSHRTLAYFFFFFFLRFFSSPPLKSGGAQREGALRTDNGLMYGPVTSPFEGKPGAKNRLHKSIGLRTKENCCCCCCWAVGELARLLHDQRTKQSLSHSYSLSLSCFPISSTNHNPRVFMFRPTTSFNTLFLKNRRRERRTNSHSVNFINSHRATLMSPNANL